ncbi:hypothetical protein OWR28_15950 [Chryseobacterium sp. 1B4]
MKYRYIYIALLSVFSIIIYGQNSQQKHYIFFLHNKFLEGHSLEEKHPKYGVAEYEAILHQLKDNNTVVISEKEKQIRILQCMLRKWQSRLTVL